MRCGARHPTHSRRCVAQIRPGSAWRRRVRAQRAAGRAARRHAKRSTVLRQHHRADLPANQICVVGHGVRGLLLGRRPAQYVKARRRLLRVDWRTEDAFPSSRSIQRRHLSDASAFDRQYWEGPDGGGPVPTSIVPPVGIEPRHAMTRRLLFTIGPRMTPWAKVHRVDGVEGAYNSASFIDCALARYGHLCQRSRRTA